MESKYMAQLKNLVLDFFRDEKIRGIGYCPQFFQFSVFLRIKKL